MIKIKNNELSFYKEAFELDVNSPSGLRWKTRPRNHFATDGAMKKMNSQYAGKLAGTKTSHGYWQVQAGRQIGAHRVVWSLFHDQELGEFVIDHIDGNSLNNSIENLRKATFAENSRNRKVSKSKKIQLKGIHKHKGKFRASIYALGKKYGLGTFVTQEAAHEAYCNAAKEIHGTFARYN